MRSRVFAPPAVASWSPVSEVRLRAQAEQARRRAAPPDRKPLGRGLVIRALRKERAQSLCSRFHLNLSSHETNGRLPHGAGGVPCFLNTASIAAWAHFSPSALDTPIEPITSPSTTIGKAPGCGKSCMKVGARFWPERTILFISEVGRRQRSADFAFSSAVSIELAAAPSMAWDSIRFPAQSNTDIASVR